MYSWVYQSVYLSEYELACVSVSELVYASASRLGYRSEYLSVCASVCW